ncbi:hypothetical protein BCR44DRAFT_1428384 [Catenaria anguillulae PL171]|uniref:Uncharacterized protein n=1 Tax=Catenaria anguillulae PL171 TaxID=765915 RepID=A0A1Y2HV73_9FUNG|nr:hypothetical protein BCR44DRAFT_1428384 [Catenaria anguillulae PL171]
MYSYSHAFPNAPQQRPPAPAALAADAQQAALHTMVSRWSRLAFNSLSRQDRASFATAFSMRDPTDHIRLAKALKNAEEASRASSSTSNSLSGTISSILASVTGGNTQIANVLDQFFKFLLVWATDKVTLDRVLEEYALFYRDLLTLLMATTQMGPLIWPLVALIHRQMIAISRQVDYARNVPNKISAIDSAWNHVFAVLPLDSFPVPLRAPYHAFLGKRAMIVNDDATAEFNLTQAIHLTPRASTRNLRILMCQLIAVRLSAGQPPPQYLLEQYQMSTQWTPVLQAMRRCDFPAVEQAIDQNMPFFRAHGVYGALIERPRAVMMRLCARKWYLRSASVIPQRSGP